MLLWLATAALAQEPSPARLCAEAAQGTEVEVCLRLASEHPDQVQSIAAALRGHVDRASASDRELLAALLLLAEDATAQEGTRRLALLGDPRGVAPLVQAVKRRDTPVALAAVDALATHPQGLGPLVGWVGDARVDLEVRIRCARVLGPLGSPEAVDALVAVLRQRRSPSPLRAEILAVLQEHHPEALDQVRVPVVSDGTPWLTLAGGWGLGYSLTAAGQLGGRNLPLLGGATGGLAGSTAGWALGRAWPVEAGDAALVTVDGMSGTGAGILLGSGLAPGEPLAGWLGGVGGELVGYGLGAAMTRGWEGTPGDALELGAMAGLSGLAFGAGAGFVQGNLDDPEGGAPRVAAGVGVLGGMVAAHWLAPRTDLDRADANLILTSTALGGALGLLVPLGELERHELGVATAATGALVGYALSEGLSMRTDIMAGVFAGGFYGGAFGAGVGLLMDPRFQTRGQVIQSAALLGTAAGALGGGWASWRSPPPMDPRDLVFTWLVGGWSAWQSAVWAFTLSPRDEALGWYFVVPSTLGAVAALSTPWVDLPMSATFGAGSLGLWGGTMGGAIAQLSGRDPVPWLLVGSDLGLAMGLVVALPPFEMPPLVIGLMDAGGVLGGSLGALGGLMLGPDTDAVVAFTLVGAGVGLVAGGLTGHALHQAGRDRDVALVLPRPEARIQAVPTALTDGERLYYGLQIEVSEW